MEKAPQLLSRYVNVLCFSNFVSGIMSEGPVQQDFNADHQPGKILPCLMHAFENLMENAEARAIMLSESLPQLLDTHLTTHWKQYTRIERILKDLEAENMLDIK